MFGKQLAKSKIEQALLMMDNHKKNYKDYSREDLEKSFIDLIDGFYQTLQGINRGLR